ncbi:tRNA-processing RNAse BN [Plasticicumulans lactativorans]|uniref:tRNA-processing RNAse BN n=1 Tax=Plasticicumulans lactativorans TaxID=1133106 RepID=A0A4R2LCA7_9GAMM|nr:YhjD/YihY/BrkB family envelope integrity protein [Plasticicumulans lactativorans]TCO83164.1 tRNA-processing RNAse BN [Plasticicumulans lactativorans]
MDPFTHAQARVAALLGVSAGRCAGVFTALLRALLDGHLLDRSASLAYTTLLSLVPLLAVSFSVLKAFGAQDVFGPLLDRALEPLGTQGHEVAARILEFVGRLQVGVLGWVGLILLFYSVITLVHKIELAFNAIWGVPTARGPARRVADYLSVLLIGPVLIFAALGLTDTVRSWVSALGLGTFAPLAEAGGALLKGLPHLIGGCTFAFLYGFLPNTRVPAVAAVVGGAVALLLWLVVGQLFGTLMANSGNYPAIYSGFAGAVLFILWLNVAWLIVLLGAEAAHAWQRPPHRSPEDTTRAERLAFGALIEVGLAYRQRRAPPDAPALATRLGCAQTQLDVVLDRLLTASLLRETAAPAGGLAPGCDPATLPLTDVLAAIQGTPDAHDAVGTLLTEMHAAVEQTLAGRTLHDLLDAAERAAVAP